MYAKHSTALLLLCAPALAALWWYEGFHRYNYRPFCEYNKPAAQREAYCRSSGKCHAAPYEISTQKLYDDHCWGILVGWPNKVF